MEPSERSLNIFYCYAWSIVGTRLKAANKIRPAMNLRPRLEPSIFLKCSSYKFAYLNDINIFLFCIFSAASPNLQKDQICLLLIQPKAKL